MSGVTPRPAMVQSGGLMWSAAARFPGRLWRARRRVGIVGIGAVVAALVAVTWGVCTASAEAPLGPHEARYDITLTGVVVVDFGPLGTLRAVSYTHLTLPTIY